MIKRLNKIVITNYAGRGLLTAILALTLVSSLMPTVRTRADQSLAMSKLSPALQQGLDSSYSCVWSDSSKGTVRTVIQTFGPVSPLLLSAVTSSGGAVVRQFTSINGILAELPKNRVLTIAARADVEHMTADHLGQQSASHLETATGADTVRTYNSLLQTYSGLDGSGVGIAILDSGIMAGHSEFGSLGNLLGLSRVTAKTDI